MSPQPPENTDLLKLALARAAIVAGLGVLGAAMIQNFIALPTFPAFGVGVFIGGVIFFQDLSHIFADLEKVWKAHQKARRAQLRFEAALFSGEWSASTASTSSADDEPGDDDALDGEPPVPPSESAARALINHPGGAYTQPTLSAAEQEEMRVIGDCVRFLAVAGRAEGLSLRVMQTCRPPQFTPAQFEKWWGKQTDQLAYWGIVEKSDRQTTRFAARYPDIQSARRALTHREFRRHPLPPRSTDRQTDSPAAQTAGAGGAIWQPGT